MAWTYLLHCADDSYYVGSARDLDARMADHASGHGAEYTAKRLPVRLVWAEEFERVDDAWALERRIHGWSRAKKEALIDGRFGDLPTLSRGHGRQPPKRPASTLRQAQGTKHQLAEPVEAPKSADPSTSSGN
ncbi:GIY-YIG nuclease family protein [Propionicimonas sp.]|jgi:putative endonuclease|uniref:GIY-YIG nuclease family protein n=1 Tax=Propionicimonas sp. TaxID=1955623 RepID=UPI00181E548A|nr:GIY-YIG nuclease family protein [Propionicimonas sp.]MBU3975490.1 GIY-YIG nuclease family protein [Actinomycetota bacterium]MBA3020104.1 GIY-YIG nuclease family protein [Propionicimonas sp.]MBU3986361.1 GIY-YIG nuclease family protein [Actinomycetota bacterium]MBU4007930.1 GIY-YIG nuclease family protein [Actinomycetota bacterium]MBU4064188.1 GIY-YIG nuclease family protein [Actinomycetota bacterium]